MLYAEQLAEQLARQPPKVVFSLEPPLFCKTTTLSRRAKGKSRAVLCTEFSLYLYKKKFTKGYIPDGTYSLSKLAAINSSGPSSFSLQFDTELHFVDPHTPSIVKLLTSHMTDVRRVNDMPSMRVNGAAPENLVPSAQAFTKCIRFLAHSMGRRLS
jgi:hypothetical protein